MNEQQIHISRALISVSDKTGIVEFARHLASCHIEILSTGGTAKTLGQAGIPTVDVSQYTGFPEMMEGRVKTLHPRIAGGILGLRDRHAEDAATHNTPWIDLVVCNLYPFKQTISQQNVSFDDAIEQIDIGGPTMLRAAAKNFGWVVVVTSCDDYQIVIDELLHNEGISYDTRKKLAAKAFAHTACYDALIQQYLTDEQFPQELSYAFTLQRDEKDDLLRYGENPHQKAAVYRGILPPSKEDPFSLLTSTIIQGKRLSFNNLGDTWGAVETLREFNETACVVVKHATPCGVSAGGSPYEVLTKAFEADNLSAFGGIIAINSTCDKEMATYLSSRFIEVLVAPSYTEEALSILAKKKNLRVLSTGVIPPLSTQIVGKYIGNDLLLQERDVRSIHEKDLTFVTQRKPDAQEIENLLFAWKVVKHVKSNAIVTSWDRTTHGIGGGQVSRVDATKIALEKSKDARQLVLASDAFFPFRDSIDAMKGTSISAIIQPGGSIRDEEVIAACNEQGIAMAFTGVRCFLHG